MQFALGIEIFVIILVSLYCLFYLPVKSRTENKLIVTSNSLKKDDIEMTLTNIISQLHQIQNSGTIQRIAVLPEAHPELETIMSDALHYTMELHQRISEVNLNSPESLQ